MTAQTWRVVTETGEVAPVVFIGGVAHLILRDGRKSTSRNLSPLWAVADCVRSMGLVAAVEIRAPGELTTAEAVAAAVAAETARCVAVCNEWAASYTGPAAGAAPAARECARAIAGAQ